MSEGPRGLNVDAVSEWLASAVARLDPPFEFDLIAAGGSNLTYDVRSSNGNRVALRRPPEGSTLATAHDTDREYRVMSALHAAQAVPVPQCLARCDDIAVTGAAFIVMDFVDGQILRTSGDAVALTSAQAAAATAALINAQVAFHTVDLQAVGLATLGRHDGYVARQLKRWVTQVERADTRPLPLLHELHDALSAAIPAERAAPALAHGDYRFDNVVLDNAFDIAAVLDWELCTTGDPIADFAWSAQYWGDPDDHMWWLPDPPTLSLSFPRRAEVIRQYQQATGFDLSDYPFYEAFSWWKQACIVEGAYARRLRGSAGGMESSGPTAEIAERADAMFEHAHTLVSRIS